jgi:probable F420-dependent oxidoreductase
MTEASRRLRIGVQLPEVERRVAWPEYAAMARAAEESGFDSVWVGDHLLYRGEDRDETGPWDGWTLLAAIAAATERIHLGPLVACSAFRTPGILARTAAAVDEVSEGRLILGIGAGWNEAEFQAFGVPFDHRGSRFIEEFEILRRLLDGERVTFAGRFQHTHDAVLLPIPSRRPPLMIGSSGERILRATLPHADAWNAWFSLFGNTPEGFAKETLKVDAALEDVGLPSRKVSRSACVLISLGSGPIERSTEGVAPIAGTMEEIGKRLREFAEAGADEAIVVVSPITETSIRDLAEMVTELAN